MDRKWARKYEARSAARGKGGAEERRDSDKIFLPELALQQLLRAGFDFPLRFLAIEPQSGREAGCSVVEFTAPEGHVEMFPWLLGHLGAAEGDAVVVRAVTLPGATRAVIKPLSREFFDVADQRAALEASLRDFGTLTCHAKIRGPGGVAFEITQLEPGGVADIADVDLAVDFEPPDFPVPRPRREPLAALPPPESASRHEAALPSEAAPSSETAPPEGAMISSDRSGALPAPPPPPEGDFVAFSGQGFRLSGEATATGEQPPNKRLCRLCGKSVPADVFELHLLRCQRLHPEPPAHGLVPHPGVAQIVRQVRLRRRFVCPRCLGAFFTADDLKDHGATCS